ncbi:MAG: hypothetical protein ACMUIG_07830 [Thermoplasmatota archaeon]
MEETYDEEERKGIGSWLKNLFSSSKDDVEEEKPRYSRRLLDGRIEKYLDQNMNSYIEEYGIMTELDLQSYETRYEQLTGKISEMNEYMAESDARISAMEREMSLIKKESKSKKK